jgi:hypothetical protein
MEGSRGREGVSGRQSSKRHPRASAALLLIPLSI